MDGRDSGSAFDELVAKGLRDLHEAQEVLARQNQVQEGAFEGLDGRALTAMLHDRKQVDHTLIHPDPLMRAAALILLKNYWPPTPETGRAVERMVHDDPDPRVRGVAILTALRAQAFIDAATKNLCLAILQRSQEAGVIVSPTASKAVAAASERSKHSVARSLARKKRLWEALAGDALPRLLESRDSTQQALHDADPKKRMAALTLLCDHWPRRPELRSILERMASEDPDLVVRALAIVQLGIVHRGTNDMKLGTMLASLVYDELKPARIRRAAYSALLHLRALPVLSPLVMAFSEQKDNEFPAGCDWAFVDSFLCNPGTDGDAALC